MLSILCIDHVSIVVLNFDNNDNCNNKKIADVNIVFHIVISGTACDCTTAILKNTNCPCQSIFDDSDSTQLKFIENGSRMAKSIQYIKQIK